MAEARCPICRANVTDVLPTRPFCSPRCRLVDLGNWLGGRYRIAGEANVDDVTDAGSHTPGDDEP